VRARERRRTVDRRAGRDESEASVRARASTAFLTGALLLLVAACGGGGDEAPASTPIAPPSTGADGGGGAAVAPADAPSAEVKVASADGLVELRIPGGALPAGVAASDIRVTAASLALAEPLAIERDAAEAGQVPRILANVQLEPSGLRFERPVTVVMSIPRDVLDGPLVIYHASEEGVDALDVELLPDDAGSAHIRAAVTIDHFSGLVASYLALEDSDLADVQLHVDRTEVPVNETFAAWVTIERKLNERVLEIEIASADAFDGWKPGDDSVPFQRVPWPYELRPLSQEWFVDGAESSVEFHIAFTTIVSVTPMTIDEPSTLIRLSADASYESGRVEFTCVRPGPWRVWYLGYAQLPYEALPADGDPTLDVPHVAGGLHKQSLADFEGVEGRCVGSSPSVTATETPTPQSSPVPGGGNEVTVGPPGGGFVPAPTVPGVSMTAPVDGQPSTVTITSAPNTSFLKITCHQPTGGAESCSAFVLETGPDGSFSGQTEMLMGPGVWSEFVCLPASKCTEEFPGFSDLRAFGEGCRNGACVGKAVATAP
jgi:hypothetical protein